ncbi:MAG: glycosyltransferase family 2 protein [Candidatus Deferrimicrobiaceae bacterium]
MKPLREIVEKLLGREGDLPGGAGPDIRPEDISIGITTFEHRFQRYFVPLLDRIREGTGNEIIVAVNGEHEREFGEEYRRRVLEFIAGHKNVYPVLFPRFRGLSKLWNSIIVHATHDYILMLNDDIMIRKPRFLEDVCAALRRNGGRTFVINRSWSHFVVSREEIDELGYFDERLLGIGEEDGDITWRYMKRHGREIPSFPNKGFENYAEETVRTYQPVNIQTHSGTKYSLFNRKFVFEEKYAPATEGARGMFEGPVELKDPGKDQYPNERFYRLRKKEL